MDDPALVLDYWRRVCLSLDAGSILGRRPRGRFETDVVSGL